MTKPTSAFSPQSGEDSFRRSFEVLQRRTGIMIRTFVFVITVGSVVTLLTAPVYRSKTSILIEGKSSSLGSSGGLTSELMSMLPFTSAHEIATQIEVLAGDSMVASAAKVAHIPLTHGVSVPVTVQVKQIRETEVLNITSESTNKNWALAMARQLPITYNDFVKRNRRAEVGKALQFAQTRLSEERIALQQAEKALETFHQKSGLTNLEQERAGRISDMMTAQASVRAAEAEAQGDQARLDQYRREYAALPRTIATPATVTNNEQLAALHTEMDELKKTRASLLVLLQPNHSQIQRLDAEISNLQTRIAQTPKDVTTVTTVPNPLLADYEAKIADASAAQLASAATLAETKSKMGAITGVLKKFSTLEIKEADLIREVSEHSGQVDELLSSVNELNIQFHATHDPVQTVSAPTPPEKVAPKTVLNIAISCLLGIILGISVAFLQEFLDDHIHGPEDVRHLLSIPTLGFVPMVGDDSNTIIDASTGGFLLESYRVLRSNIQFSSVDMPVMSLLVTSTLPSEGKTTTAANIAIAMALDGRRVMLVDGDLRRPTLHDKFGLSNQTGLTNVLRGKIGFEEALQESGIEGLSILTAGPLPPNPAEILNSQAMHDLHQRMKSTFDIVVFDSPPCLASADAQVLASMVDGVLYIMQLGVPRKSAVVHSFELLNQAHARILGLSFNKVDLSSKRSNYYGYYGYYSYYDYYRQYTREGVGTDDKKNEDKLFAPSKKSSRGKNKLDDKAVVATKESSEDKKEV